MWTWFHKLGSPPHAYRILGKMAPWFGWPALVLILVATWWGLWKAPTDYQQGDAYRILYIHAPSAWMSMFAYVMMAVAAAIGLIWRIKIAHAASAAGAPIGASFTFLALATGSIWGKPIWGVWWTWDARLTLTAILFTIYVGYLMLRAFAEDPQAGARYGAVLAILGFLDIPLNHFAVQWWRTLHQPSSILRPAGSSVAPVMLVPLAISFVGLVLLYTYLLLERVRLERIRHRAAEARLKRGRRG